MKEVLKKLDKKTYFEQIIWQNCLRAKKVGVWQHLVWFILRSCQPDDGYIDGRSQIKVHTDERTQVHSTRYGIIILAHIIISYCSYNK